MKTHLLARAVIQDAGHVLVAQARGFSHTFLPGGHIEPDEGMRAALTRELSEELGLRVEVSRFLGVVEFWWTDRQGQEHYELNHLFSATSPRLRHDLPVASQEAHLSFEWVPLEQLDTRRLEPFPLRNLIREGAAHAWFASAVQ
ncbi:NUDIX domain-containing protein [Deinococcus aluminii]|uniref:Nudix hydrolase domain-containing protein n=1 Tax=Deinococcus aluminii TaxID=1656885 RepID=A0ABP9XJ16_9DEIO